MTAKDNNVTDLVEGNQTDEEWAALLAADPELAREVEVTRRVRALVQQLHTATIALPDDFEARLMERVRADVTVLDMLELWFGGASRALLDLLGALFGLLPQDALLGSVLEQTPRPAAGQA